MAPCHATLSLPCTGTPLYRCELAELVFDGSTRIWRKEVSSHQSSFRICTSLFAPCVESQGLSLFHDWILGKHTSIFDSETGETVFVTWNLRVDTTRVVFRTTLSGVSDRLSRETLLESSDLISQEINSSGREREEREEQHFGVVLLQHSHRLVLAHHMLPQIGP